jgi:hypothetical protein
MGNYYLNLFWQFIGASFTGGIIVGAWHWNLRRRGIARFRGGFYLSRDEQPEKFDALLRATGVVAIFGVGLGLLCLAAYGVMAHLYPPAAPQP